jgi:hypothetical protein
VVKSAHDEQSGRMQRRSIHCKVVASCDMFLSTRSKRGSSAPCGVVPVAGRKARSQALSVQFPLTSTKPFVSLWPARLSG